MNMHFKTGGLIAGGLFLFTQLSSAQTKTTEPPEAFHLIDSIQGPALYTAYCAVCHGRTGRGDGPAAIELKTPPRDLATLARRHDG